MDGASRLRGCIGTFTPQPLEFGLTEYSSRAAFHDQRFPPITSKELSTLECSVSILGDIEKCSNPFDWELGVHGINVYMQTHSSEKVLFGTFLPEIAMRQGWSKRETVEFALRKGGWRDQITDKVIKNITVYRYKTHKYSATWDEYMAFVSTGH